MPFRSYEKVSIPRSDVNTEAIAVVREHLSRLERELIESVPEWFREEARAILREAPRISLCLPGV